MEDFNFPRLWCKLPFCKGSCTPSFYKKQCSVQEQEMKKADNKAVENVTRNKRLFEEATYSDEYNAIAGACLLEILKLLAANEVKYLTIGVTQKADKILFTFNDFAGGKVYSSGSTPAQIFADLMENLEMGTVVPEEPTTPPTKPSKK